MNAVLRLENGPWGSIARATVDVAGEVWTLQPAAGGWRIVDSAWAEDRWLPGPEECRARLLRRAEEGTLRRGSADAPVHRPTHLPCGGCRTLTPIHLLAGQPGRALCPDCRDADMRKDMKITEAQSAAWIHLHTEEGRTPRQIASAEGVSTDTVRRTLRQHGVYRPLTPQEAGRRKGTPGRNGAEEPSKPVAMGREAPPLATGAEAPMLVIEQAPRNDAAETALRAERDAAVARVAELEECAARLAQLVEVLDSTPSDVVGDAEALVARSEERGTKVQAWISFALRMGAPVTEDQAVMRFALETKIGELTAERDAGLERERLLGAKLDQIAEALGATAGGLVGEVQALRERAERLEAEVRASREAEADECRRRVRAEQERDCARADADRARGVASGIDAAVRDAFRRSGLEIEYDVDDVFHGILLDRLAGAGRTSRCTSCEASRREVMELTAQVEVLTEHLRAKDTLLRATEVRAEALRRVVDAHEALRGAEVLRMEAEAREHEAAAELTAAARALEEVEP